jgi:PAS domain S-box-containing protein
MNHLRRSESRPSAKRGGVAAPRTVPRGAPAGNLQVEEGLSDQDLLEESRARYASLYDYAPIGYVTLDRRTTIRELNFAAAALLGQERRALYQTELRDALTPASRRALDAHLRACFKDGDGRPHSVELTICPGKQKPRIVELVSIPGTSPAGARGGRRAEPVVNAAMHDISVRKHHDREREDLLERERQARHLAESASRMTEEFLAVVSHELRTPLAPMMMWTKALRAGGAREPLRLRAIEALESCLAIQAAMIDDLVDVARGRLGRLRVERRPTNVQEAVNAAVEAMAPACAAKHITLAVNTEATPAWISGDAMRLQQIVTNLVSNAIKFTSDGGHVSVALHTDGAKVVLYVRDDGEGIEPAVLETIFEPFRRSTPPTSTTPRQGGLGLGLSIVRQLVLQHDGTIVAQSQGRRHGACFIVTFPAVAPPPRAVVRSR